MVIILGVYGATDQYHANGCNQCITNYFKKDYNYQCADCQETFGDDCMHCTDFLGCQQCHSGTRTYDDDCGLFYCKLCDDTPSETKGGEGTGGEFETTQASDGEGGSTGACGGMVYFIY